MPDRPDISKPSDTHPSGDDSKEPLHWAGHGHVGAFLLQLGMLIAVNLAAWGFIFLMALRLLGKPMPWGW